MFQSLLHQGVVRTNGSSAYAGTPQFQSLLHQGVVRTRSCRRLEPASLVSIPSSSGRRSNRAYVQRLYHYLCFNPFFIRASFEHGIGYCDDGPPWFQSLLHQGVVRTRCSGSGRLLKVRFNPFFIRASFERPEATFRKHFQSFNPFFIRASFEQNQKHNRMLFLRFNPFFIRASFEPDQGCCCQKASRFNPFFIRASFERIDRIEMLEKKLFQSLLHQGVVRTRTYHLPESQYEFQSLLHQGVVRTVEISVVRHLKRVSIPSSSGRRSNPPHRQNLLLVNGIRVELSTGRLNIGVRCRAATLVIPRGISRSKSTGF